MADEDRNTMAESTAHPPQSDADNMIERMARAVQAQLHPSLRDKPAQPHYLAVARALIHQTNRTCLWMEDSEGTWKAACDHAFVLNDGTPAENGMRFCCYCGGGLRQKQYQKRYERDDEA